MSSATILVVAGLTAATGMALLRWATQAEGREVVRDAAWLLLALGPALILFSTFPDAELSLTVRGVSGGGAVALFIYIWHRGTRLSRRSHALAGAHVELRQLRDQLAALGPPRVPSKAPAGADNPIVLRYRVQADGVASGATGAVGLFGGDVTDVTSVDVWVNSENVYMQMSRFFERTLSGVIRYGGATKDDHGQPIEDVIGDELSRQLDGHIQLPPASVLVTSSGELSETNDVRWIVHVAAVYGEVGSGYRQVVDIARCVDNALTCADRLRDHHGRSPESVLLPLFGAGTGGGDTEETAATVVARTVRWLTRYPDSSIRHVWMLGYTVGEVAALRQAIEAHALLEAI